MKIDKQTGPSKRMIESLLKELGRELDSKHYDEYVRLGHEMDELTEKLTDVPQMRKLKRAREAAYTKYRKAADGRSNKVRDVRRMYLSKGLTPQVLKAIDVLVKELGK